VHVAPARPVPQIGYPHQTTLVYAIPFSGRPLPPRILMAYHGVLAPMNYNMIQVFSHAMPIDAARQSFAEGAIAHKAKYLYFWDEDVEVPPQTLRELIYVMEQHDDVGVVGGVYCLKTKPAEPLVFRGVGKGPYWDWKVGEIFECDAIGMGCTLIRVAVFEDLEKPWFRSVDDTSPFLDAVNYGEQWTEDLYFCDKVKKTGKWKILAHGQLLPPHINLQTGEAFTLPPDSKPMRAITAKKGTKKILDIGAGGHPYQTDEGTVLTVDLREETKPDYRCDFRRLPFGSGEFDIVYSSHSLEHIPRGDVGQVLDEWMRVVAPKGELRLIVPSLDWAAEQIVQSKGALNHDILNVLYGQQEYKQNFHQCGFTAASLGAMLTARGFGDQQLLVSGYNLIMTAKRGTPKAEVKAKAVPKRKGTKKR